MHCTSVCTLAKARRYACSSRCLGCYCECQGLLLSVSGVVTVSVRGCYCQCQGLLLSVSGVTTVSVRIVHFWGLGSAGSCTHAAIWLGPSTSECATAPSMTSLMYDMARDLVSKLCAGHSSGICAGRSSSSTHAGIWLEPPQSQDAVPRCGYAW